MTLMPPSLTPERPLLLYDGLEPGLCLGSLEMAVDAAMLAEWRKIYGDLPESDVLPLAFAPVLLMRAMLTITAPRPPGNLHVGQNYRIERMPQRGASIFAKVTCNGKELRRDRRVVRLRTTLSEQADTTPIVAGSSTIFWAR